MTLYLILLAASSILGVSIWCRSAGARTYVDPNHRSRVVRTLDMQAQKWM